VENVHHFFSLKILMKYDRYINNKVLVNCRRPQRKDWCAPITVAETIEILLNKHISVDTIAKQMKWSPEMITGGRLGTAAVIKGVQTLSGHKIHAKTIHPKDNLDNWNKIKGHIKNKLLYYHQPGHHLLICGYIEEPLIKSNDLWNHENVGKPGYGNQRKTIIKSEHNLKKPEDITQGMLVPEDFQQLCKNIGERKNSDLVVFWI